MIQRRAFLTSTVLSIAGNHRREAFAEARVAAPEDVEARARGFVRKCLRADGSYAASNDLGYKGMSDTAFSELAAPAYAVVLARTFGWEIPEAEKTARFIRSRQVGDGRFLHRDTSHDPKTDHAVLYNATQAAVALRALGARPDHDPSQVIARYETPDIHRKLPAFTYSFYPLFYAASGLEMSKTFVATMADLIQEKQKPDGYLDNHVAGTFHAVHFHRLLGLETPKAGAMTARTLHDQKSDGSWSLKSPDWDVHACFDATFILRQLGTDPSSTHTAMSRAEGWARSCQNPDGGFGHFPGRPSDMDATYFHLGTLVQTGFFPGVDQARPDAHLLGWGHLMRPGAVYARS